MIRPYASIALIIALSSGATTARAQIRAAASAGRGVLTIRLIGWDGASPVNVRIAGFRSGAGHTFQPGSEPFVVRRDTPFDTYDVWAADAHGNRLVRGPVRVTVDAEHPEQLATLDFRVSRARVRVVDDRGDAATNVTFVSWGLSRPPRIGRGLYSLAGLPAGATLRILGAARHAPGCTRVPFEATVNVGLDLGRRLEIHWTPTRDSINPGWEIEVEGSACPIFLSDVRSRRSELTREPVRVVYYNFPVGRAILRLANRTHEIPADVDGPVMITRD